MRPLRVAVVGGGCAALAAAFELTKPEQRGRFDVTVYQSGHRLGGKGASSRGVHGRIEEHGLHLWLGFYENAFRLMRDCYAELGRDWRDAFEPCDDIGITERAGGSRTSWKHWVARFPAAPGLPGDALRSRNPYSLVTYLRRALDLVVELLRSARAADGADGDRELAVPSASLLDAIDRALKMGQLASTAALLQCAQLLRAVIESALPPTLQTARLQEGALRLLDVVAGGAQRQLALLGAVDGELRRVWHVIDLVLAIVRGTLRFGLLTDPRGFDAINDYDWREWLRSNGASDASLSSGFLKGFYDLTFAYVGGDPARPALAAGVALRGAVRMFFTYRGAMFWRMRAGMGDVVFAPLYEVLRKRGVRFAFFHRLTRVGVAHRYVDALDFDIERVVRAGVHEYRPLVDVHGLACWPADADAAQLEPSDTNGAARSAHASGRTQLRVGADFDFVVLGVGLGAIPDVARELIARHERWAAMVERVQTTATQAFQLWLRDDMRTLGWTGAQACIAGFVEPFDTWADMTHLLRAEAWPPSAHARAIAYFCSALADGAGDCSDDVKRAAVQFLERDVRALWPGAVDVAGGFRWDTLVDDRGRSGSERFASQFWAANTAPSDRYVQSLPGSARFRISPLDNAFDNFTVAGDWTASGLDSGCVESAVMSGLLASHALSGSPSLADIVGYDHP